LTPEPASLAVSVSAAPGWTATVTLNALDADVAEIPVPVFVGDAVRVSPSSAVSMVIPGNVAKPDEVVLAEAPEVIVPVDGVSVIGKVESETLFPNWSVPARSPQVSWRSGIGVRWPWTKASALAAAEEMLSTGSRG